jgi:hypothetical protein
MAVVCGVTMEVVNVVVMVEVAHRFVAATGSMNVGMVSVDDVSFEEALVPVVSVGMMDVALVQVVGVVAVWHGDVPTGLAMGVLVYGMDFVGRAGHVTRPPASVSARPSF